MITHVDIAKHCNVSKSAVAKVLQNPKNPEFTPETRQLVLNAAKELHYVPNSLAAGLRTGKTAAISFMSAWNITELQDTFALKANALGYSLQLQLIPSQDLKDVNKVFSAVLSAKPSGIIWLPGWGSHDTDHPELSSVITKISQCGLPIVWLEDTPPCNKECDFVWFDDEGGMKIGIEHLISCGYKKFYFLTQRLPGFHRSSRWPYFKKFLEANGFKGILKELGPCDTPGENPQVRELVKNAPSRTAIFCEDEISAIPVTKFAAELAREIPDEIGVIALDGTKFGGWISISEITTPTISTIRRPFDVVALSAIEMLNERMSGKYTGKQRNLIIPTHLIERNSTTKK